MSTIRLLDEWGWSPSCEPARSAYLHVPFCRHRCGYCNFSLLANRSDLFDRFISSIQHEIGALEEPRLIETLFLGGGTPSILPATLMIRLFESLGSWMPISEDGEVSIEANPLDITHESCKLWKQIGINRISIGGQSFDTAKLKCLERDHSPQQLIQAVETAKQHFDDVSLDLIFAAPGETLDVWRNDLECALKLGIGHISTYGLTFEKGAKFWGLRERRQIEPLQEDIEASMYEASIDILGAGGLEHYEISNFAVSGRACRHNQTYWEGRPWWAFGPSAARYIGGVRSVNHRGTSAYIHRIETRRSPVMERDSLSEDQQLREKFVFGMRQLRGVDWGELSKSASDSTRAEIEAKIGTHEESGWIVRDGARVKLTRRGLMISDSLWSEYL